MDKPSVCNVNETWDDDIEFNTKVSEKVCYYNFVPTDGEMTVENNMPY